MTLGEIAAKVGARLEGNGDVFINDVAPVESARPGDISFIADQSYFKHLDSTEASAIVLSEKAPEANCPTLRDNNPVYIFALIVDLLYPDLPKVEIGIDSRSIVDPGAEIDPLAAIGPLCHIREKSKIGAKTQVMSSVYVGRNVRIGDNCLIYPGVQIMDESRIGNNVIIHSSTVIGSDGFGYVPIETGLKKIKQVGHVVIHDDVEIGSNVSIDRGALGPTVIGEGTKVDNLVQIAHNVVTGRGCILVGQVGISGSTKLGDGVVLGGQVGLAGHLKIGDKVQIGAQSGIKDDIEAGKRYFGSPAREFLETARIEAAMGRLPELLKRVKQLEKQLAKLRPKSD